MIMTMTEAIAKGIARFREPQWTEGSYMRADLFEDGTHGPWLNLFDRRTQEVCEFPTPQPILLYSVNKYAEVEEYKGELDKDDSIRDFERKRA